MSVYRRKGSPNYHYEFQFQGARFRGSTGETTERAAQRVEARIRAEIEERARSGLSIRSTVVQLTLGDACSRFWLEKAQFEADSSSVFYQLENLVDGLGKSTLLSQITMSDLAEYQARRRGQVNRRGKLPANQSINAECPDLIRRVFNRAKEIWSDQEKGVEVAIGGEKDWAKLKLRRPKGRTRELHAAEQTKLEEHLRDDYAEIIEFATITGLRRSQLILRWPQVDFDAGVIRYRRKSLHEDDIGILAISGRMQQLLLAQRGNHRTFVFTYVAKRTMPDRGPKQPARLKGKRYPITEEGLKTEMRRSVKDAGIEDWRVIHDLRHTAASRTLRASKNMAAVQSQLGHSDIASTSRYAHVLLEDLREALDATSPRKIPTIVEIAAMKRVRRR